MMKLSNFRFYKKQYKSDPVHNVYIKKIEKIIKQDKGCFYFACEYFFNNSDNKQSVNNAYNQIILDIEITSLTIQVDEILGNQLASLLSTLHNLKLHEYRKVRDGFIEFITLRWRVLAGKHSNVYIEPNIYYKRKQILGNKPFKDKVADIVRVHRKKRIFEMYECKTTMRKFLSLIAPEPYEKYPYKNYKGYKNVSSQKRKQDYLHAFYDLVNFKTDAKTCVVAYVTLAKKSDLKVENIGEIPIITRESILSKFDELFK